MRTRCARRCAGMAWRALSTATRTGRESTRCRSTDGAASAGYCPTGTSAAATSSSLMAERAWCAGKSFRRVSLTASTTRPPVAGTAVALRGVAQTAKDPAMAKTRSKMNAIDLLKEDHTKVKKAFKEFEEMEDRKSVV